MNTVDKYAKEKGHLESERFVAFRSHYGFDSFYCRPGKVGAYEKGRVEGDIGYARRNHLVHHRKSEVDPICWTTLMAVRASI